jgi:hypothetical protein
MLLSRLEWKQSLRQTPGGAGCYGSQSITVFDKDGKFSVGWQGQDSLWQGHATKFAPNGKPLSPITTGFTGGGMEGGTFGAAVVCSEWRTSLIWGCG